MNNKIIWAITQGEYSDYGVVAIMASKELAEEYAALHQGSGRYDTYRVEEFDFLDSVPEHVPVLTITCYVGGLYKNKDVTERIENVLVSDNPKSCTHNAYYSQYGKDISITVRGTDFERVRKVFSEQRAIALTDPRLI